jgi:type IV secretion system protein VirD4
LTPDEVLRLPRDEALVIFRGQKVLKVKKFDFTKHPEAKKLRTCNARNHIPNWRSEKSVLTQPTKISPVSGSAPPAESIATAKAIKRKEHAHSETPFTEINTPLTGLPEEKTDDEEIPVVDDVLHEPFGNIDIDDLLSDL